MKYLVTAAPFDITCKTPKMGEIRTEEIDTRTNELFHGCETICEVEMAYEHFWNYISDGNRVQHPKEKVKVLKVDVVSSSR